MVSMADMYELSEPPPPPNLLKKSIDETENVCRDEEYIFESSRDIKEIEMIPAKITILRTKKESKILKTEEDPRKPWYFAHV